MGLLGIWGFVAAKTTIIFKTRGFLAVWAVEGGGTVAPHFSCSNGDIHVSGASLACGQLKNNNTHTYSPLM